MQRKSIGHSRRKHGEHGAADFKYGWRNAPQEIGPVNSGDVLPKMAITRISNAAATCIGPVSFVSKTRHNFNSDINSRNEVLPAKS